MLPTDPTADRGVVWRGLQAMAAGLVVVLLAVLAWTLIHRGSGARLVASIQEGKTPVAPEFNLAVIWPHTETWPPALRSALTDGKVELSELRGYPVVLNFWASWCVPCKHEAPQLASSARQHAGTVVFLAIDGQDLKSAARRFLNRFDVPYVSLGDGNDTFGAYGLTGLPETYYIDAGGRVGAHDVGEVSRRNLEQGIATITG
jgi:cytochrome c biogenesis protein CcmG/thiol:disulfide interchange protein DsbE